MTKNFYRPELTATHNEDLFEEELINEWQDRAEDLRLVAPPDSAEEYFALLLLMNRFDRLPKQYYDQVAQERIWIQTMAESLTNAQIKEAVELFDADYWRTNFNEASEMWLSEEIDRVEAFDRLTDFMDDLDGFGACLVYGTKRGIYSFAHSHRWDTFFTCCQELRKDNVVSVVLDRWVQSTAKLIREDIDTVDYETACIVEYFEDLLDQMEFREHQERGDRLYQGYVLALFRSVLQKEKEEELKKVRVKKRVAQVQRVLSRGNYAYMAAAPDDEPELERFFMLSPSKPWKALLIFKENEVKIRFYQQDQPEIASGLIGRTVRFCGFPRTIDSNGEICFKISQCGNPISLEVDEEQTGPFVQWVKEYLMLRLQETLALTNTDPEAIIDFYSAELRGLERYWRSASDRYDLPPRPLPTDAFSILLVIENWTPERLFYPSVMIPLRWNKTITEHNQRLPKSLAELADKIKERLQQEIAVSKAATEEERTQAATLDQWYLEPGIKYFPDLSSDSDCFTWDSGAIPLAASLLLVALDGNRPPKSDVFASGAWDWSQNRLQKVKGLQDKIDAAKRLGGTRFFLPEFNALEKPELEQTEGIKVSRLQGKPTLLETVDVLRRAWLSEPADSAAPEENERYYRRMEKDHDLRRAFYRRRLAQEIARRSKNKNPVNEPIDLFVSWVSTGAELINVAANYFQPKKIILLYTPGRMETMFQETRQSLHSFNIEGIPYDKPARFAKLNKFIETIFQDHPARKIAIDLTLGTVPMTLTLRDNAPDGTIMVYWHKEGNSAFDIIPLSTQPEIFIKGEQKGRK